MRIGELVAELSQYDEDAVVLIPQDAFGNRYTTVHRVEGNLVFFEDEAGEGTVAYHLLTTYLRDEGFTEDDVYAGDDVPEAVILWPR